jgi:hypothetical protein
MFISSAPPTFPVSLVFDGGTCEGNDSPGQWLLYTKYISKQVTSMLWRYTGKSCSDKMPFDKRWEAKVLARAWRGRLRACGKGLDVEAGVERVP